MTELSILSLFAPSIVTRPQPNMSRVRPTNILFPEMVSQEERDRPQALNPRVNVHAIAFKHAPSQSFESYIPCNTFLDAGIRGRNSI